MSDECIFIRHNLETIQLIMIQKKCNAIIRSTPSEVNTSCDALYINFEKLIVQCRHERALGVTFSSVGGR